MPNNKTPVDILTAAPLTQYADNMLYNRENDNLPFASLEERDRLISQIDNRTAVVWAMFCTDPNYVAGTVTQKMYRLFAINAQTGVSYPIAGNPTLDPTVDITPAVYDATSGVLNPVYTLGLSHPLDKQYPTFTGGSSYAAFFYGIISSNLLSLPIAGYPVIECELWPLVGYTITAPATKQIPELNDEIYFDTVSGKFFVLPAGFPTAAWATVTVDGAGAIPLAMTVSVDGGATTDAPVLFGRIFCKTCSEVICSWGQFNQLGSGVAAMTDTHPSLTDISATEDTTDPTTWLYDANHFGYTKRVLIVPNTVSGITTPIWDGAIAAGDLVECVISGPYGVYQRANRSASSSLMGMYIGDDSGTNGNHIVLMNGYVNTNVGAPDEGGINLWAPPDITGLTDAGDVGKVLWETTSGDMTLTAPTFTPDAGTPIRKAGFIVDTYDPGGGIQANFVLNIQNDLTTALDAAYDILYDIYTSYTPDVSNKQTSEAWTGLTIANVANLQTYLEPHISESANNTSRIRYLNKIHADLPVHITPLYKETSSSRLWFALSESCFSNDLNIDFGTTTHSTSTIFDSHQPNQYVPDTLDPLAANKDANWWHGQGANGSFRAGARKWESCQNPMLNWIDYDGVNDTLTFYATIAATDVYWWYDVPEDQGLGLKPAIPEIGVMMLAHDDTVTSPEIEFYSFVYYDDVATTHTQITPPGAGGETLLVYPDVANPANTDYLYIGDTQKFANAYIDIDTGGGGTAYTVPGDADLVVEYWNGTTWATMASVVDGTHMLVAVAVGGPLSRPGYLTFRPPTDWANTDSVTVGDGLLTDDLYWIRLSISGTTIATPPTFNEITVTRGYACLFSYEGWEQDNGANTFEFKNVSLHTDDVWIDNPTFYAEEAILWSDKNGVVAALAAGDVMWTATAFTDTDALYFGMLEPCNVLSIPITPGAAPIGAFTVEYGDNTGAIWTAVTGVIDYTSAFFPAGPGQYELRFDMPVPPPAWQASTDIDGNNTGVTPYYWIKITPGQDPGGAGVIWTAATSIYGIDPGLWISADMSNWKLLPMLAGGLKVELTGTATFETVKTDPPIANTFWHRYKGCGINALGGSIASAQEGIIEGGGLYGWDAYKDSWSVPYIAPTVYDLVTAGNVNAGAHDYGVTFITPFGESAVSALVTLTVVGPPGASQVALTGIPLGPPGAGWTRKLYRTTTGTSGITNLKVLATLNATDTTYTDNTADGGLGAGYATFVHFEDYYTGLTNASQFRMEYDFDWVPTSPTASFDYADVNPDDPVVGSVASSTFLGPTHRPWPHPGQVCSVMSGTVIGSWAKSGDEYTLTVTGGTNPATAFQTQGKLAGIRGARLNIAHANGGTSPGGNGLFIKRIDTVAGPAYKLVVESGTDISGTVLVGEAWSIYTMMDDIVNSPNVIFMSDQEMWIDVSKKAIYRSYPMLFSVISTDETDTAVVTVAQSGFNDGVRYLKGMGVGSELFTKLTEGDKFRFYLANADGSSSPIAF